MVVNNLSYQKGVRTPLKDVSFSIPMEKKGVHGLLAPKGAGKTLLLDLLAGCLDADEGEILVKGEAMSVSNAGLRAKIGYVPQNVAFYADMTAAELLDFVGETRQAPADRRYRQICEALELLGIADRGDCLIRRLNATERKRLSVAAALLGNTELLLFDDLFWGKSDESRREWSELLAMLGKHKTVLIADRSLEALRLVCSDVLLMSDGILLAHDSFDGLEEQLSKRGMPSLEDFYNELSAKASALAELRCFCEEPEQRKEKNEC